MAILRSGWRVVYQETARARTEAPATLRQLSQQRYRWSYGTMQAMWKHRRSIIERGASGRFGRRGLPLIGLFTVVLPLFAPLLDVLTVFGAFFLDRWVTIIGWLAVLRFRQSRPSSRSGSTGSRCGRCGHSPCTAGVPAAHVHRARTFRLHRADRRPAAVQKLKRSAEVAVDLG
jgi:hypothetical protein